MNKHLTAKNETRVLRLISDIEAKTRWQMVRDSRGIKAADIYISNLRCVPLSTVKAARFYW